MSTSRSKFRLFKYFINFILLSGLAIVLSQNVQKVDVDLIFWQVHIPLVVLLLGTAIVSALIVFISVLIIGRR